MSGILQPANHLISFHLLVAFKILETIYLEMTRSLKLPFNLNELIWYFMRDILIKYHVKHVLKNHSWGNEKHA